MAHHGAGLRRIYGDIIREAIQDHGAPANDDFERAAMDIEAYLGKKKGMNVLSTFISRQKCMIVFGIRKLRSAFSLTMLHSLVSAWTQVAGSRLGCRSSTDTGYRDRP